MTKFTVEELLGQLSLINGIGVALSRETDTDTLLEKILLGVKELTNADAGSLYILAENKQLKFSAVRNNSLNIALGGTTGNRITFPPIPLYDEQGNPNLNNVVSTAVLKDKTINIPDAYTNKDFDFSGTKKFDESTGYQSKSFLTIPLRDHEHTIIGVLQLINRMDLPHENIISFSQTDQELAESLSSQAAVTLTKKRLIDDQKQLFEDFIQLIAKAIDEKSPYTGGHCTRVPILALMIADAINDAKSGTYQDFSFTPEQRYELEIAAWLHDCGKVTTPEFVVDKATKLETITDRIENIQLRFEIIKRDNEIALLKNALADSAPEKVKQIIERLSTNVQQIANDLAFIEHVNIGGEFLSEEDQTRIAEIGKMYQWSSTRHGVSPLLTNDEITNLQIARGTLNHEERQVICNHVSVTLKMLESLHYPKGLEQVPEIAGSHHEKMDGTGYPRKLTGDQMTLQARIVAVADVFEALTAADRPYKPAKSLSESLRILGFMAKDGHIDPEIFQLFIQEEVYMHYAHDFLRPEQMDEVDISKLPGYDAA